MRTRVAAALMPLMLISLPACSSLQVKTEQDWDAEFARYHTYAWSQGMPARDPSIESQIHNAVDFELPFKGLAKVEMASSPDLHVYTYVAVEEEQAIDHWGYDVRTGGAANSPVSVLTLPIGTLAVHLVDAKSGKLVWRGQASKAVDRQASEEVLRKVVREIFRRYPRTGSAPQDLGLSIDK
jgi:Domain of unknown function (DUF4136)